MDKIPKVNVSLLIIKGDSVLLGLLSDKWLYNGEQVYGSPGRDIYFQEKMGDAIKRNIVEELGCEVTKYEIICVNANYDWGNHYIGIGAVVQISGEPKLLKPDDWVKWEWINLNAVPSNILPELYYLLTCYKTKKVNVSE